MYLQLAEDAQLSALFKKRENKRNPVASVTFASGRALFLALISMNIDGLATKLARRNWNELQSRWLKVGGNPKRLSEAINKGKSKKPKKINFLSKLRNKQMNESYYTANLNEGYYLSEELSSEAKAKIISAATAAGTAVGTIVPGIGNVAGAGAGASLGGLVIALYPVIKQAADDPAGEDPNSVPAPVADVPAGEDVPDPNTPASAGPDAGAGTETFFQKYKTPLLIGGGLIAAGALYYSMKKR